MAYHGIDKCDRCDQDLEKGKWLVGLCKACEAAKRPGETTLKQKGLVC